MRPIPYARIIHATAFTQWLRAAVVGERVIYFVGDFCGNDDCAIQARRAFQKDQVKLFRRRCAQDEAKFEYIAERTDVH